MDCFEHQRKREDEAHNFTILLLLIGGIAILIAITGLIVLLNNFFNLLGQSGLAIFIGIVVGGTEIVFVKSMSRFEKWYTNWLQRHNFY